MPIEAAMAAASEWQVGGLEGIESLGPIDGGDAAAPSQDFGGVLGRQLENLAGLQAEATEASASLANGTAADPSSVVMAVERAQLSMQLASQLRTKGVEAINEVFRTQV